MSWNVCLVARAFDYFFLFEVELLTLLVIWLDRYLARINC